MLLTHTNPSLLHPFQININSIVLAKKLSIINQLVLLIHPLLFDFPA